MRGEEPHPALEGSRSELAALDDAKEDHHDRDDEQNVDQTPHRVGGDKTEHPEDEEDDDDCFKHGF